jgi:hypothetical protein
MTPGRFLDEQVVAMPPVSMATIEMLAETILVDYAPEVLDRPTALDVKALIETKFQEHGIHVAPASYAELADRHGATDPKGQGEINILLSEQLWNDLFFHGSGERMARSTVIHEFCHALLHVPIMRRRLTTANKQHLLARQARGTLPAYCDPEWQAWALCGALMMPTRTLRTVTGRPLAEIAAIYQVSERFVTNHARRLRLPLVPQRLSPQRPSVRI